MKQINPKWRQDYAIKKAVDTEQERKDHLRVKKYIGALKHFHTKPAICSQCKRAMRPDIAKIQIENKRKDAPICFACIQGYERKPLNFPEK